MTHKNSFKFKGTGWKTWIFTCLLICGSLTPTAQAATNQPMGDVGALLGAAFASQDIGTHFTWGLTTHYTVSPEFNVGLFYNHYTNDTTVLSAGGTKYTTSYNNIALEANYLLSDAFAGAYVGGKLGWAVTSVDLPNSSAHNNFVFGPAVGYDYLVGNNISAGGQLNILWRTGDPFFADTNLLFVLKYNFM